MGIVLGEVVQIALGLEQRALDARLRRMRAGHLLPEPHRVLPRRAVDERRRLHDDLAHGATGGAGSGEQVQRADDVDLVQGPAAHARRVHDQERVQDGVDLGRLHDAVEDRVRLVGLHVLGALELDAGLLGVDADDHVDVGVLLQCLRQSPAPEGAEAGDEDAATHRRNRYPNQTLRRWRNIS